MMPSIIAGTGSIDDCEDDYEDDCLPVILFSYRTGHYRFATRHSACPGGKHLSLPDNPLRIRAVPEVEDQLAVALADDYVAAIPFGIDEW